MRLFFTFTLLCSSIIFSYASQTLEPHQKAPLYVHLYEVNTHWMKQAPSAFLEEISFQSERKRIQKHLELVTKQLSLSCTDHLSPQQKENRDNALIALAAYSKAGSFPKNLNDPMRKPIFVDDFGTACAVGHLLLETQQNAIVSQIHKENNFATIEQLLAYRTLPNWAEENGFTIEELAWIQPAYAVVYFTPSKIGDDLGISGGTVRAMLTYEEEVYFVGDFTALDGFEAYGLAAWNGEDFRAFPGLHQGLDQIHRIAIDEWSGNIYAVGTFPTISGPPGPKKLARYSDGNWESILDANAIGSLNDIACIGGLCYIAGDYAILEGDTLGPLFVYDIEANSFERFNDSIQIIGEVNDLSRVKNELLAGGAFDVLDSEGDTLSKRIACFDLYNRNFLSYSQLNNLPWWSFPHTDSLIAHHVSIVRTGPDFWYNAALSYGAETLIGNNYGQDWYLYSFEYESSFTGEAKINGLLDGSPNGFGLLDPLQDNIEYLPLIRIPGFSASPYWPVSYGNGAITAMARYGEELIIAGDFTELDDIPVNQLARATLLISDNEEETLLPEITVGSDGLSLFIKAEPLAGKIALVELFDLQGRLVWTKQFLATKEQQVLIPPVLSTGTYAYRIATEGKMGVGKVFIKEQ